MSARVLPGPWLGAPPPDDGDFQGDPSAEDRWDDESRAQDRGGSQDEPLPDPTAVPQAEEELRQRAEQNAAGGTGTSAAEKLLERADKADSLAEKLAIMQEARTLPADLFAVVRRPLATALKVTVEDLRGMNAVGADSDTAPLAIVEDHEPFPEPVDGYALLTEIIETVERFFVFPGTAEALCFGVYSLFTHGLVYGASDAAPYLLVLGPEIECGKTLLARDIGSRLFGRAISAESISNAALFRVIDEYHPCVILDEIDNVFANAHRQTELIATINAGTRRGGRAVRCVGDSSNIGVRAFDTFAAYVLVGIDTGTIPAATRSRGILIALQRKPQSRVTEDAGADELDAAFLPLGRKAARWAQDHATEVRAAAKGDEVREALKRGRLGGRRADLWRPLLAVVACMDVPELLLELTAVASGLAAKHVASAMTNPTRLLVTLRTLFYPRSGRVRDFIPTHDILEALLADEEAPWKEWKRGKGLIPRDLANLLKPFEVFSKDGSVVPGVRLKGYTRASLETAWDRYLVAPPPGAEDSIRVSANPAKKTGKPARGNEPAESATAHSFSGNLGSKRGYADENAKGGSDTAAAVDGTTDGDEV